MTYNLITILGPTATGKTALTAKLAAHFNGEIISADSRQVYRGMDIGTGKDINDYTVSGKKVKYHLIDIIDPSEEFNLFEFKKLFTENYNKIVSESRIPFLAGGTGLYLSSVLQNYELNIANRSEVNLALLNSLSDNELRILLSSVRSNLHNTTDLTERSRMIEAILIEFSNKPLSNDLEINSLNIGISFTRQIIKQRITERLKKRLKQGLIEEVDKLLADGISYSRLISFGLEYKFVAMHLTGKLTYNDMFQKLNSSIHKFAKRQMTWFRKMERNGYKINWLDMDMTYEEKLQEAISIITKTVRTRS